jgi:hypothetical protein
MEEPVYENGADAAAYAKERNESSKRWGDTTRFRVIPLLLEDPLAWRLREQAKLNDGTHKAPPWVEEYGNEQLAHIDPDDPTKIRFFQTIRDAHRGRYTSMSPGRYFLNCVNPHPAKDEVENFCAKMGLDMTVSKLQLAKTADEIEFVYTNGPHSCMAYKYEQNKFSGGEHPVRMYGDLDLACAYITRGDEITARCMVWPEKKQFGRIYGDSGRIRERLKEEGYTEDWDFIGARLQLKHHHGMIVAPYVDGDGLDAEMSEDGQHLVLSRTPTIILKSPDGVAEATECVVCGASNVQLMWSCYHDTWTCEDHHESD